MVHPVYVNMSWDSSVNIVTGYELDGREIRVQFLAEAKYLSLPHSVQTASGVNLTTHVHLVLILRIHSHSSSWLGV
jgi:hypothetical protein